MKRATITKHACILIALLLSPLASLRAAGQTKSASRPNIVFILADDLGWADLPVYGNRFNEAPNLTRLAGCGMRFTDAYASAPVCSPSRASIMSGQYPARVGIMDFIPGHWRPYEKVSVPSNRTQYLPTEIVSIAETLKTAGYATAFFGKWHLGNQKEHHPSKQGFDEANVGQGYFNVRFNPEREDSQEKIMAERLADFGVDFIERNKANPFFLFLSHWDVHVQFDAAQPLIDKFLKVGTTAQGNLNSHLTSENPGRDWGRMKKIALLLTVFVSFTASSVLAGSCGGCDKGKGDKKKGETNQTCAPARIVS